jgi:hypothetical protein
MHSEICMVNNSVQNKEELLQQWKEWVIVPIYKKGNKTNCSTYWGISLLSTTYRIVSNILPSRLTPYADEIIRSHHHGFWCIVPGPFEIMYSAFVKVLIKSENKVV